MRRDSEVRAALEECQTLFDLSGDGEVSESDRGFIVGRLKTLEWLLGDDQPVETARLRQMLDRLRAEHDRPRLRVHCE